MARWRQLLIAAAALLLVSGTAAQNNFTRVDSGLAHTADATARSKQIVVTKNGGLNALTLAVVCLFTAAQALLHLVGAVFLLCMGS